MYNYINNNLMFKSELLFLIVWQIFYARASSLVTFYCNLSSEFVYYKIYDRKCTIYLFIQVPLAIFKREKEIARRVEFDGLYIAEMPEEDDIKAHWDKMVISAKTFPVNYWDKFVKKKVRQKYSETYDFDYISNLLGMEKTSFSQQEEERSGLIHL